MCSKKSCYVVPIFLLIIIAALCVYIFLCTECKDKNSKSNNPEKQDTVTNDNYTYSNLKGYYTFKDTNSNSEGREGLSTFGYTLYLSENGTFRYQYVMNTVSSVMGNYIIVDDEIRLNYLFTGGSDAGINTTNGSKVLKIKDKNTLVDNEAHFYTNGGSKTIDLTKDNSTEYNSKEFDLNYIVNNYEIANTNY